MPLKKDKSKKIMKENIKEIVKSYKKTGKIGTSRPRSKDKAVKQAVAIAYSQQRRSKKSK
jgi:hypothetical protein